MKPCGFRGRREEQLGKLEWIAARTEQAQWGALWYQALSKEIRRAWGEIVGRAPLGLLL